MSFNTAFSALTLIFKPFNCIKNFQPGNGSFRLTTWMEICFTCNVKNQSWFLHWVAKNKTTNKIETTRNALACSFCLCSKLHSLTDTINKWTGATNKKSNRVASFLVYIAAEVTIEQKIETPIEKESSRNIPKIFRKYFHCLIIT